MNKKVLKKILITMVCFIIIILNAIQVQAKEPNDKKKDAPVTVEGSNIVKHFSGDVSLGDDTDKIINKVIGTILSAVRIISAGIAVIMTTYLGTKYMSSAPTEKASIKNQMIAIVTGSIVAFGAATLLKYANEIAIKVFDNGG